MKNSWICLLALMVLVACKGRSKPDGDATKPSITSNPVSFRVDLKKQSVDTILISPNDTAFVVKNKLVEDDIGDKQKSYLINVFFAPKNWPMLAFDKAIGADISSPGDLDGDGQPELLLRPEWFSSCWSSINLFSLKHNRWKLVKTGSMYFCSDQYPLAKRIIKSDKGYALLTDSLTDDKFIVLKKEIKF